MNVVNRQRWYRLFNLVMVLLLMSGFLRPRIVHASAIVERWRGRLSVQGTYDATTGILLAAIPGIIHEQYTLDFDLQVDDTGFLNGDVYATLQSATFDQYGDRCGIVLICKVSQTVGNPNAHVFVEGIRYVNAGQPEFSIDHMIKISPGSKIDTVSLRGAGTQSDPEDWYPDLLSPGISPYVIQPYNLGRPPIAQVHTPHITSQQTELTFSGQLIGTGLEPLLDLDPELLEHSIFVAQVPIEDNFDANVDWNSSDAGWLTWQLGQQGAERVGPTKSKQVKKPVDVGFPAPGQTTLQVQAHNTIGKDSQPQNVQITVAPPVGAPDTRTSAVTGKKQGDFAAYKFSFKFPEPAFKLQVKNVGPIPFFDRGPFGIADTQATGEVEFKSTGEGSGKASVATAFEAMGSQAKGEVSVKTKAVLQADGLKFPEGEFGLKVSGKLKGEEPLIVLIPSLGAALNNILSKFPTARSVINKARVVLEVEPKIGVVLTLLDQNGDIKFKNAQAQPGLALTGSLVLDLIKDILTATGSIGGDAVLRLQVPAPYFQGGDLKLFAKAQLAFFRQAYNAEASYNGKFLPSGLAAVNSAAWSAVQNNHLVGAAAAGVQGAWQPMDTAYLADPHYGHWNTPVAQRQQVAGPVDNQLMDSVSPLANPSLAVRNEIYGGSLGSPQVAMVWAQDQQGVAQSDIKFTQGSVEYAVNDDNLDDFNPKVVFLPSNPDQNQLIVWQRFDSATPGDLNTDPNGYLSHLQIAATHFNYNSSAREPVQLLSNDNTLNYRQQLVATNDGALTVWINNPANQILGDTAHPDRLMFARYTQANDNGSWSAAAAFLPSIAGLLDYKLAAANGHVALVYSQDTDGNMETDTDRELFYMTFENNAWSGPQRLTNNAVADEAPQLALTASGTPLVIWKQIDQLLFLNNAWTGAPMPLALAEAATRNDFTLVGSIDGSAALTWQEVEPQNTQIGYAIYDALYSRWSTTRTVDLNPAAAPGTIHMANNIGAALAPADELFDGGRAKLFLGYQLTNMQLITRTVDGVDYPNVPEAGTQSLHLANIPLSTNLSITPSDLTVTPLTAQPGDPLTIQAVLHNTGDLAIPADKVPVVLKATNQDQETTVLATQLLPTVSAGEAMTLSFATTRQATGDNLYSVEINPVSPDTFDRVFREAVYTDNVANVGSALLASSLPTVYATNGAIARIAVTQNSGLYSRVAVTSTLRLNSPTGPQIAEIPINFPITQTVGLESSSWVTASLLGPGSHQLYWAVDPNNAMGSHQLENNLVATTVNVFPDLSTAPALIGWGRDPGNEAPISLRVENRGNWASTATTLAVWDKSPDQADSHLLAQIPIPAIEAGGYVELTGALNLANTPAATTGLQSLYVQIDPDRTVEELSENNNVVLIGTVLGGPFSEEPPSTANAIYLPLIRR